ncbi:MAG: hypothetical protein GXX99_07555 [Clostridiales bacterium]|nr:hypothetical protein [Clostridiales bacterium]
MNRRLLPLLAAALLLLPMPAAAAGPPAPVTVTLPLDSGPVTLPALQIEGVNHFWLRDLAVALGDTDARFDLRWDAQRGVISLLPGADYAPLGDELQPPKSQQAPLRVDCDLLVGGRALRLHGYALNGRRYVALGDLAPLIGLDRLYAGQRGAAFDLGLRYRMDHLPDLAPGAPPSLRELLFFAFFTAGRPDPMPASTVDRIALRHFGVAGVAHASTREWRLEGAAYHAAGWSFASACPVGLVELQTYEEAGRSMTELTLDCYELAEFDWLPADFSPLSVTSPSPPLAHLIEQKRAGLEAGQSVLEALRELVVEGDTAALPCLRQVRVKYALYPSTGEPMFICAKTLWK